MELFYRPHHRNAARGVIGDIGLNFKHPKKNRRSELTRPAVGGVDNRAQFRPIAAIFLHVVNHHLAKSRATHLGRAVHQSGKVVRYFFAVDGFFH